MSHSLKGIYFAVSSGLCFGLLGYFGMTLVHSGMSITTMLFWRFFLAMLIILPVLLFKSKSISQDFRGGWRVLVYDSVFYSLSALTYFQASAYIGTGLAMVIFFTYPVFVMLFNVVMYKSPIQKIYYLAFPVLFIGLTCLSGITEAHTNYLGIFLSIFSAFFYACYIFSSKSTHSSPELSTVLVSFGCSMIYLTIALYQGHFVIPMQATAWINMLGIAFVCTAMPILLFLKSLKYLSSVQASMLSVTEPIFVAIFGVLLLHEHISAVQVVGIILTLSSAALTLLVNTPEELAC